MAKDAVTRRRLLGYGAAGATALLTGLPRLAAAEAHWGRGRKAKNVIFCVSDGMSVGVPTMVDHYQQATTGERSYWSWLMGQDHVVNGLQDTRSLTGMVTDSSAASSSWGSGVHIWNGAVNWLPDGSKGIELRTLFDLLGGEAKMKTGLVTTATVTHATPVGFALCHETRDDEAGLAEKYLAHMPDVLMGGGGRFFDAANRKDKVDLYAKFAAKGCSVVRDRDAMLGAAPGKPVLGIFSQGHVPYSVDRNHDDKLQASVPTLAEMSRKAIELLNGSHGFVLQIEGARIDHGGHTNDFGAMLFDQIAFEEAVKVAVEFALADGDTLVVITSDHGNANPGLAGAGTEYAESTAGLLRCQNFKSSFLPVVAALKLKPDLTVAKDVVKDRFDIELKDDEAQLVVDAFKKSSPINKVRVFSEDFSVLAMALSNHTHVSFMTHTHTSDHVLVTALGPGCEAFSGVTQNISYFDVILAQRGLKWKNPTVSYEDALKYYSKPPAQAEEDHWL